MKRCGGADAATRGPAAVLIVPEDLDSLEETLAILSDPEAMRRLVAADAELADGLGESEAHLAAAMGQRGRPPVA